MDESLQMGMITKCSCIDELESDAFNIARVLSQKPYKSLTHTKRLFKQGSADLLQQHIQLEMEAFGICLNYRAPASGLLAGLVTMPWTQHQSGVVGVSTTAT